MSLTQSPYSAHLDTFTRENLPPRSTWPEFLFTGPELQYPASINCATDLLDRHVMAGAGSRRCLVTDTETWTYADLLARSNQVAHVLIEEAGLVPGNRVLLRGRELVRSAEGGRSCCDDDASASGGGAAHHGRDRADEHRDLR